MFMVIFHEIQCDGADRRERRRIEECVQHSWYGMRRGTVRFILGISGPKLCKWWCEAMLEADIFTGDA